MAEQKIGWKYKTPLKADYLNSILDQLATPGVLFRPTFSKKTCTVSDTISVKGLEAIIIPADTYNAQQVMFNDNNTTVYGKIAKIWMDTYSIQIQRKTCAIGLAYSLHDGVVQTSVEASLFTINYEGSASGEPPDLSNTDYYKIALNGSSGSYEKYRSAVIIGMVVADKDNENTRYVSGINARCSNVFLKNEGWTGTRYVGFKSAFESNWSTTNESTNFNNVIGLYNINSPLTISGVLNGRNGLIELKSTNTRINLNLVDGTNKLKDPSEWNLMKDEDDSPYTYQILKFDTENTSNLLSICAGTNDLTTLDKKTIPGSIIAIMKITNKTVPFDGMKFIPIETEKTDFYFEDDELYIK